MNIRQSDLEAAVRRLNPRSKRTYQLDGAYGGWKLQVQERGTSVNDVTAGYGTKPELYYQIHAILRYLDREEQQPS
jgi:hypothetical protein